MKIYVDSIAKHDTIIHVPPTNNNILQRNIRIQTMNNTDKLIANIESKGWLYMGADKRGFTIVQARDTDTGYATLAYNEAGDMFHGHYDMTITEAASDYARRVDSHRKIYG